MATDTNLNWMLIRIRADTLVPSSAPGSAARIEKQVVERFALSTLAEFEANGHKPQYFKPGQFTPTALQKRRARAKGCRPPLASCRLGHDWQPAGRP